LWTVLTEIHLCRACSCQEISRMETARQGGTVREGVHRGSGERVAVKTLKRPSALLSSRQRQARASQEAAILRRLAEMQAPNVVTIRAMLQTSSRRAVSILGSVHID
jgi:hypothetical protein